MRRQTRVLEHRFIQQSRMRFFPYDFMAASAARFQSFHMPFAIANRIRFFNSWLRRIAPDTHQDQANGAVTACRLGGSAAPEERSCRNASNRFITDPWLPKHRLQSISGSRRGRSALLQTGDGDSASHSDPSAVTPVALRSMENRGKIRCKRSEQSDHGVRYGLRRFERDMSNQRAHSS